MAQEMNDHEQQVSDYVGRMTTFLRNDDPATQRLFDGPAIIEETKQHCGIKLMLANGPTR